MKKRFVFLFLAMVIAGGVFAQEKYDGSFKNTITFGFIQAGYERLLYPMLSVGAEAGTGLMSGGYFDAFARWYPWQRIFFANLGLGYQFGGGLIDMLTEEGFSSGFFIQPQVGWKVDIGEPGAWIFEARVGIQLIFAKEFYSAISIPILLGRTF